MREDDSLRSRLPPPNSIVAFEAAARCGSFTRAAQELGVTQAAVSRQIRRIESFLGVELFRAVGRGRILTDEGQEMFEAVTIGLAHVASTAMRLRARAGSPYLTIGMPLAFASLWLGPRIGAFRSAHPDVDLRLLTDNTDIDPNEKDVDIAIRFGDGNWPHLRVTPLTGLSVVPVCSPGYARQHGPFNDVEALLSATLLDRDVEGRFSVTWAQWFMAAGVRSPDALRRTVFDNYEVLIRAAIAGGGIALGVDLLVRDLLDTGFLITPVQKAVNWGRGYYLVLPDDREPPPSAQIFMDWLQNEVRQPLPA